MKEPSNTVFLERESYRKRRTMDAAQVLPVIGVVLVLIPLFWGRGDGGTSAALIYYFGVWLLLIVLAAMLSRRLGDVDAETGD